MGHAEVIRKGKPDMAGMPALHLYPGVGVWLEPPSPDIVHTQFVYYSCHKIPRLSYTFQ